MSAVDGEQAVMIGAAEIELALYVILFYGRAAISNDIISYRMYIGARGYVFRGQSVALTFIEPTSDVQENQTKLNFVNTGYFFPYVIDRTVIARMNRIYLQITSNILNKSQAERADFEKLIITAIGFYGMAINEYDQRSSFINFITCLESLLLKEREPQKGILAERVAIIIRDDVNDRKDTFEKMEHLYKLRSDFLHRGMDKITQADISLISYYAFEVIIKLISYSKVISDSSKFGGPAF